MPVVSRGWAGLGGSRSADFGRRGGGVGAAALGLVGAGHADVESGGAPERESNQAWFVFL